MLYRKHHYISAPSTSSLVDSAGNPLRSRRLLAVLPGYLSVFAAPLRRLRPSSLDSAELLVPSDQPKKVPAFLYMSGAADNRCRSVFVRAHRRRFG